VVWEGRCREGIPQSRSIPIGGTISEDRDLISDGRYPGNS
jgi:hypothetical protein